MVKYLKEDRSIVGDFEIIKQDNSAIGQEDDIVLHKCLNKDIEEAIIPDGVTTIGCKAFSECENLKNVVFPDGLKCIMDFAFDGCVELRGADIPSTVTTIGSYCFSGCDAMEHVNFPPNSQLTYIGMYAFGFCGNLRSFKIPNGVCELLGFTFFRCFKLNGVSIPECINKIREYDFGTCISLKHINIPDDVRYVSGKAFDECNNIVIDYKGTQLTKDDFKGNITSEFDEFIRRKIQDEKDNAMGLRSDTQIASEYDFGF